MNSIKNTTTPKSESLDIGNLLMSLVLFILLLALMYTSLLFMRDTKAPRALVAILALLIGVGGIWSLFYLLNQIISSLSQRMRSTLLPLVFIGPALAFLTFYLLYPIARTILLSFYDRTSENFVGFANYITLFTDPEMLIVLRNTVLWIVIAPLFAVIFGLLVAVMTDHLSNRWERIVKSLIFLPMAISFIGASVIWRFVYYFQPPEYEQIGLLNAIITSLGGAPQAWLTQIPWKESVVPWFNNIFLIMIMVWLQTGFAMVILSAAVKGVPRQLLEAARIDGSTEVGIFFRIIIPCIKGTILTVTTTILITVLKIFDIPFVMTSGQYDTDIVASRMYVETFKFLNYGRGSALSVLLFIGVIPFIIRNIRHYREEKR